MVIRLGCCSRPHGERVRELGPMSHAQAVWSSRALPPDLCPTPIEGRSAAPSPPRRDPENLGPRGSGRGTSALAPREGLARRPDSREDSSIATPYRVACPPNLPVFLRGAVGPRP